MVETKGGGAYWKGVGDGGGGLLETWSYGQEAYREGGLSHGMMIRA